MVNVINYVGFKLVILSEEWRLDVFVLEWILTIILFFQFVLEVQLDFAVEDVGPNLVDLQ